jgi:alkylhydroperoxidase family enzyme
MLKFALKVSNDSRSISASDFSNLTKYGFSNDDIWDIAGITAFFGLSNRMANFTSMQPNLEFYRMGRDI